MIFWRKKDDTSSQDSPVEETVKGAQQEPIPSPGPEEDGGWFSRLSQGLSKSARQISQGLGDVLTKRKLDQEMLDALEDTLISADLGPATAAKIIEEFSRNRFGKDVDEQEVRTALADSITGILEKSAKPLEILRFSSESPLPFKEGVAGEGETGKKPFVIMVCGVNGVGKTTTIGKMAHDFRQRLGLNTVLAAGDTFRAAAVEQLAIWAERSGGTLVARDTGADAAAVAYEAYEKALRSGADVLMIDTAGRLHNKANLMAELEKIVRVLKKRDESLPHAVLLVLDATTGQNAFEQVRVFREMVNVTGLIVTKLDGSAKGGVVVGLSDRFGLPIHLIGVGEDLLDLRPFDAQDYARALVGL